MYLCLCYTCSLSLSRGPAIVLVNICIVIALDVLDTHTHRPTQAAYANYHLSASSIYIPYMFSCVSSSDANSRHISWCKAMPIHAYQIGIEGICIYYIPHKACLYMHHVCASVIHMCICVSGCVCVRVCVCMCHVQCGVIISDVACNSIRLVDCYYRCTESAFKCTLHSLRGDLLISRLIKINIPNSKRNEKIKGQTSVQFVWQLSSTNASNEYRLFLTYV